VVIIRTARVHTGGHSKDVQLSSLIYSDKNYQTQAVMVGITVGKAQNTMRLTTALEAFDENIPDIISAMTLNLTQDIADTNKDQEQLGTSWIAQKVRKLTIEYRFNDRLRRLKRINGYVQAKTQPFTSSGINEQMVLHAKEHPIKELYEGNLRNGMGLCPFHDEKRPSFHIKKNNKYKCYGCDAWGDSIDFYMKQNNVNFIRAVKALQ